MCGLHGLLTVKKEVNGDDFLSSAFVAGSLRGMDSSGIASIDLSGDEYEIHKLPVSGSFFVGDKVAQRLMSEASRAKELTMCHTRHATVGQVSMDTAHPFECIAEDGRVLVGAHNGTLTTWKSKPKASLYDVDSEWALNHILREGIDAFEDFNGAFCFTWWDSDTPDTFYIARNKERPMFVAMLKSGGMAYASEAGMLYWLCERHNLVLADSIIELLPDYMYKFPVEEPSNFTKVPLPKYVAPTYNYHGHGNRSGSYDSRTDVEKVQALLDKVAASESSKPDNVSYLPSLPAPRSPQVSETEYQSAIDLGILGTKALFNPTSQYGDVVSGYADIIGADNAADVRGYDKEVDLNEDVVWHCNVIGVEDDGTNIVILLGAPIMKEKPKAVLH